MGSFRSRDKSFFPTPQGANRFWGPSNLLSNGCRGLFPRGKSGRRLKLITHRHLVQRSRMVELYIHSPIRFHCVVLNFFSLWLYSPFDLGRFFSSLILYTVSRTSWTGDQPVARPLPTHRTTQTQNKRTQTSMPQVGFESTIPVFERAKTVHTLDRGATVIGVMLSSLIGTTIPFFALGRREYLAHPEQVGRQILKCISEKYGLKIWTGFNRCSGFSWQILWGWQWIRRFNKVENSLPRSYRQLSALKHQQECSVSWRSLRVIV
jgi:hypothetical protein